MWSPGESLRDSEGLLEVVADEFVLLAPALTRLDEPIGISDMEFSSARLGNQIVGRIPNQDVREPEPPLAREPRGVGRDDESPAFQLDEHARCIDVAVRCEQRLNRRPAELTAIDRRRLDHPPLSVGQSVDARGEQGLDRRGRPARGVIARRARNCSMNSGLPSAAARILPAERASPWW